MTHSSGKRYTLVGDCGQRYEIRAIGYPTDEKSTIGWCDDLAHARDLAASISLAPGCTGTEIYDRAVRGSIRTGVLR